MRFHTKIELGARPPRVSKRRRGGWRWVEVEVELDTEPRTVKVPADLEKALHGDAAAHQAFEAVSYSQHRSHAFSIEDAKRHVADGAGRSIGEDQR